jgi:hypothetical protein
MNNETTEILCEDTYSGFMDKLKDTDCKIITCNFCSEFRPTRFVSEDTYICQDCDPKIGYPKMIHDSATIFNFCD